MHIKKRTDKYSESIIIYRYFSKMLYLKTDLCEFSPMYKIKYMYMIDMYIANITIKT